MGRSRTLLAGMLALSLLSSACIPAFASCSASGGLADADAQLRFVDVGDGQVVFTFGPSPRSDRFGVPAFTVEPVTASTGLRALRLTLGGASLRYPDGTTSYDGPLRMGVEGQSVLAVELASATDRAMSWTITPSGGCPRVMAKTYVYGKSPRAQLALTFGGFSSFTLETTSDFLGAPQDTPVLASGMGYAPNSTIVLKAAGERLWDTTTDAEGNFDSGFNIGYPAAGVYSVTASDPQGHRGATRLVVILPTNPFR